MMQYVMTVIDSDSGATVAKYQTTIVPQLNEVLLINGTAWMIKGRLHSIDAPADRGITNQTAASLRQTGMLLYVEAHPAPVINGVVRCVRTQG